MQIEKLSVRIAGEIYHDLFETLCDPIYINPAKKEESTEDSGELIMPDYGEYVFSHYRGESLDLAIAASRLVQYLEGVDERLMTINDVKELKQLFGAKLYHDLIRDQELKDQVKEKINDLPYPINDVFIYSILKLHQDFFKKMEE